VKSQAFQKDLDYVSFIVSAYALGMGAKYLVPNVFKLVVLGKTLIDCLGKTIIDSISEILCTFLWLFSIIPPNPSYAKDFEAKLDKLSIHITCAVPAPLFEEFDDDHFAQHGRVYLKLFQIARCMKWRCHSSIIENKTKHELLSQVESLEEVMKNYRYMTFSQIEHAHQEAAKLKPAFDYA
jgi:hypothetical protein